MRDSVKFNFDYPSGEKARVGFIGGSEHSYRDVYPTSKYAPVELPHAATCRVTMSRPITVFNELSSDSTPDRGRKRVEGMRSCPVRVLIVTLAVLRASTVSALSQPARYGERSKPLVQQTPLVETQLPGALSPLSVVTSDLSPAALVHADAETVLLFSNLQAWGLGAPTFCAVPTKDKVRALRQGETSEGNQQSEAWLLVWFAGARGWDEWDAPMLAVLQHRPQRIALAEEGLTLTFAKSAEDIMLMPLYGYDKPPQQGKDYLAEHGLPSRNIRTWEWSRTFPDTVTARCRFFSRALRAYPLHARETFAIDGDALLLRTNMTWRLIDDDWHTKPLKLAPLPPALALAWWASEQRRSAKPFPMTLSRPVRDPQVFTPYGPWLGVENSDGYEVRFPLLRYVHETEQPQIPDENAPAATKAALAWVRQRLSEKFRTTDWQQIWDHGGAGNYCWQVMGDRWYAKALPYLSPEVRDRVAGALKGYVQEYVLREEHYKPFRGMLLLVGPGIGTWGGFDDAGKFSSNLLETLWCYAHFTDDWDTTAQHWDTIKKLFITPLECDWKSFGRYAIAEMGDEAAPPMCMARMAYRVGDYDTYAFACCIFVRELVHHYIKQVGGHYFRLHQPWHSLEFMPEEVYLTNLWGDVAGWQIDGPTYPKQTGERQFTNRWVRFSSEDVARFYRDVLPGEVRAEMDVLTERSKTGQTPYRIAEDTAHIASSIVRLRSLLLNEPPQDLAVLAPPETWRLGRSADGAALCLSFIRTSAPARPTRLIPPQRRTAFVLGLERAVSESFPGLVEAVETKAGGRDKPKEAHFPVLRWWGWKPPKPAEGLPASEWWGFGQVALPGRTPQQVQTVRLNWNATAHVYSMN